MIDAHLTYFDMAVLGVFALSALFAFFRGFIREVLSLGAWVGAGLVTLYYFQDVADVIKPSMKNPMVAGGLSTLGLYICSLLAFTLLNSMIMRLFKDSGEVGALDNILGLLFGAFRAAFIISLAYFLMTIFIDSKNEPEWLKGAITQQYVEKGAIILGQAAPDYMVDHTSLKEKIEEANGKKDKKPDDEEKDDKEVKLERDGEKSIDEFMKKLNKEEK